FMHVWVAPVTRLTLARRDGDPVEGVLGLVVGEDIALVPALWNGSQRLAGTADAVWAATPDNAVSLMRDGSADRRRLRARAPGQAVVTVTVGGVTAALAVEVVR